MSRFGKLIENLEELDQKDIKNSAQVYAVAATLSTRLQEVLDGFDPPQKSLNQGAITKEEIVRLYGNLNKANQAYQQAYGLKYQRSWHNFLKAIQGLNPPITLEQRVEKLEETVKLLISTLSKIDKG